MQSKFSNNIYKNVRKIFADIFFILGNGYSVLKNKKEAVQQKIPRIAGFFLIYSIRLFLKNYENFVITRTKSEIKNHNSQITNSCSPKILRCSWYLSCV
jgi:hypothetical protein